MRYLLMIFLISLPITAHAEGSFQMTRPDMAPNMMVRQVQPISHEEHVRVVTPVQKSHPIQTVVRQAPVNHQQAQTQRHDQPVERNQGKDHRQASMPDYFRRDADYYGHVQVPFPEVDVSVGGFVVPDGFETVNYNGETFYYNQGVFYQEVDNQLTAIPPVLGAVVDSIPQDYQIAMMDGVHYLVTGGVYYQSVDQGFEVVQPPTSDQE